MPSSVRTQTTLENASVEKQIEVHLEEAPLSARQDHTATKDLDAEFTPEEWQKIKHRIDRRLVIPCGILYTISVMDRNNVGAASIAGLTRDLELNIGFRYSLVVLTFFATYCLFQAPATLLCRFIGPRYFLAGTTIAFGVVMIGFGFPQTWTALLGLRLLLGVLEAGFFPACVYLISTWYSRYDVHKRYSFFYLIGSLASGFAGILAYGLMQMDGLAGLAGWRWIFIIEGILTCCVGIIGYIFLIDFPDRSTKKSWRFLSERELEFVKARLAKDRDDVEPEPWNFKKWASSGLDPKAWCFALIFFGVVTSATGIGFFLPIILRQSLGYSLAAAQCLVAPPFAFAGVMMLATSWVGDKYRVRGPVVAFNALLCIIGLPIMGFAGRAGLRYFGVFLTTAGVHANLPAMMVYQANNIRGQWKRAFCSALMVSFGGIGGVAGSLIFRSQDAPAYRPGFYGLIACNLMILIIVSCLSLWFKICNKRAERGQLVIEGLQDFRYTI